MANETIEVVEGNTDVVLQITQSDQVVNLNVTETGKITASVIDNIRYFTAPDISPIYVQANAAFDQANAIYLKANTFMFKTLSVEEPTANEKIPFFFTTENITIKSLIPVTIGNPGDVTFSVRYGSNISLSGTEIVTNGININTSNNGTVFTTFNNSSIAANNYLWVTISYANTYTQWLNITLNY